MDKRNEFKSAASAEESGRKREMSPESRLSSEKAAATVDRKETGRPEAENLAEGIKHAENIDSLIAAISAEYGSGEEQTEELIGKIKDIRSYLRENLKEIIVSTINGNLGPKELVLKEKMKDIPDAAVRQKTQEILSGQMKNYFEQSRARRQEFATLAVNDSANFEQLYKTLSTFKYLNDEVNGREVKLSGSDLVSNITAARNEINSHFADVKYLKKADWEILPVTVEGILQKYDVPALHDIRQKAKDIIVASLSMKKYPSSSSSSDTGGKQQSGSWAKRAWSWLRGK